MNTHFMQNLSYLALAWIGIPVLHIFVLRNFEIKKCFGVLLFLITLINIVVSINIYGINQGVPNFMCYNMVKISLLN